MKKTLTTLLFCGVTFASLSPLTASANEYNERWRNQERRVFDGVQERELNRKEYNNIEDRQESIQNQIERETADGNGLTPCERDRIQERVNNVSESIYKYKHN
jgi:peptidoglycan hydrolase CwlO-like protein